MELAARAPDDVVEKSPRERLDAIRARIAAREPSLASDESDEEIAESASITSALWSIQAQSIASQPD